MAGGIISAERADEAIAFIDEITAEEDDEEEETETEGDDEANESGA